MLCAVKNWDTIEKLWDHAFKDRLRINSEEHPMLLAVRIINFILGHYRFADVYF